MSDSQPTPTPEVDAPKTSESKPKPVLRSKEEREKAQESGGQPSRDKPRAGGNKSEGKSDDKRRGRQGQQEAPSRSNPALARGPKPVIAKPAPEPEPETTPEVEESTAINESVAEEAPAEVEAAAPAAD
jgi:hypothetical protein